MTASNCSPVSSECVHANRSSMPAPAPPTVGETHVQGHWEQGSAENIAICVSPAIAQAIRTALEIALFHDVAPNARVERPAANASSARTAHNVPQPDAARAFAGEPVRSNA